MKKLEIKIILLIVIISLLILGIYLKSSIILGLFLAVIFFLILLSKVIDFRKNNNVETIEEFKSRNKLYSLYN